MAFFGLGSFLMMSCSDDITPSDTYQGYFNESVGGMSYDLYQEPDTTVLILNASKVACDSTETIEEVPYGDSPLFISKSYSLELSKVQATLTIKTSPQKYDYVTDKRTRKWYYKPGKYELNTNGYEQFKMFDGVNKAVVWKDHVNFKTKIAFIRNIDDKDELAFVSDGVFTHTEYGIVRMKQIEIPASVEEHKMRVSKENELYLYLSDEEVEYRFHTQEWELTQTKPFYKYIGKLYMAE